MVGWWWWLPKWRLRVTDWWNQHVNIHRVWQTYYKTIVLIDHQFDHGDLWFLHQGIIMVTESLSSSWTTSTTTMDGRLMVVGTTISIWRVWRLRLIITPWHRNHRSPWSNWCPGVDHVTSNTGAQQQYSTSNVQHTPPGTLWGTHIITQGNNTYSVPPPHISVQQEPNMLGEMYNPVVHPPLFVSIH
jgi:hypothetical protein